MAKGPSIAVLLGNHPAFGGDEKDDEAKAPPELKTAMGEFSAACESKDAQAMADAFHSAFLICESAPRKKAGEIKETETEEE